MGSEAHTEPEASSEAGLIPRFITDFFLQLQKKKEKSDNGGEDSQALLDYSLKASFLEVYGEDVYDLLDVNRRSLPLREDAEKGIVVVGLKDRAISNTAEALKVLHEGTMNRTTAATLMNLTSSRSHAVFTIQLSQVTRASHGDKMEVSTTSCFTFVDLAGSERMKKTGAEGERAREGIKINEGLLALGNVINALADEERIAKEKKIHVPYRQSKLTRLLQDALGGNSQTLFLACVSPSDTNASETLSTLHYANRARNIRNAPTKNVDAVVAELRRLHAVNRVLQFELVKSRFQPDNESDESDESIGKIDDSLLKRKDVESYMQQLFEVAHEMASPGKPTVPHSFSSHMLPPSSSTTSMAVAPQKSLVSVTESVDTAMVAKQRSSEKFDLAALDDVNPDEEMAILDHLLEIQQQDQEFEKEKKIDDEKIKDVSVELEKEEAMLLQLRESLKVYHGMKSRYEELMVEVQQLETEKTNLAQQLEQSTADPTIGCSVAIKKKLERVEMNLNRARRETMTHRENFRRAEDQTRKCKILERKVNELKQAKISLIKKQKASESRYKEATEAKTKQLVALKRREKVADKKVSKLEHEVRIHKTNLEKRKKYCTKLSDKLKQTESHLMKLLAMRQRDLSKRSSILAPSKRSTIVNGLRPRARAAIDQQDSKQASEDDLKASRYIFDRMVVEKVKQSRSTSKYEALVQTYSETMRKVVSEIKRLEQMRKSSMTDDDGELAESSEIRDIEENIADLELKLELLDSEIQELSSEFPTNTDNTNQDIEDAVAKMMDGMSTAGLRSLLLDTFSKFVTTETERQDLKENFERKEAAVVSFEAEVNSLNAKVKSLHTNLAERKKLQESGEDPFEIAKHAMDEKAKLEEKLKQTQHTLDESNTKICSLEASERSTTLALSVAQENLAVVKTSQSVAGRGAETQETIQRLQSIWEEVGIQPVQRECAIKNIERCFEDTCTRELDEALSVKTSHLEEIKTLSFNLDAMQKALGMVSIDNDQSNENQTLHATVKRLRQQVERLEPQYRSSAERRQKLFDELNTLMPLLETKASDLANDLQVLLQQDLPEQKMDNESADAFVVFPDNSLESAFLSSCEEHVRKLRVQKSVVLSRNRELQQDIADFIEGMHLSPKDSVDLIDGFLKKKGASQPSWWNTKFAERTLHDVSAKKFISDSTGTVSKHLEFMRESFASASSCRRSVSDSLKSVIERAQKALLDTVGREFDASEAYAGFHDALFRLPALSKDLILSCITEMEALIDGIDAMTQSEIEALTVVWEALKVPPGDRRGFWGDMEKFDGMKRHSSSSLFSQDVTKMVKSGEDWMQSASQRAAEVYENLDKKLEKLEAIHKEVEKLRSKQDTKSKILSLDSEIRIMNAKLLDFEDHCNKQRLLSKKTSGGALLKEERFRKQMQSKFSSNLKQLATLLQSWETQENPAFDASLLSEDVRMLLKDPNQMDSWVEERTQFMGLRTVKSQTPNKRSRTALNAGTSVSTKSSSLRQASGLTPPRKRQATSRLRHTKPQDEKKFGKTVVDGKKKPPVKEGLTSRDTNSQPRAAASPKRRRIRNNAASLRPFDNILGSMTSPNPESKE
ncbi:MAG: hypothetical protein SGILL_001299 [Bacillariaceae sp.]